ncbi:hypothetical protein K0C01_12380 [Salinarchaeum sp. IM2453]|uniref:hypothetical protein n=1 Tax=Salinarchaeum sp. IM2453 TaxID=2862870 RepID=UPI001C82D2F9|nr:hypothetical protein [Salinarchaeum sp. IM2453]QZA88558.1 hypothetical protein K0C01_12380 [Salinarchaeum sp. IM2453]
MTHISHITAHSRLRRDHKDNTKKKETTGDWSVSIVVECNPGYPDELAVGDLVPEDTVRVDFGITKFIHDSDGRSFA